MGDTHSNSIKNGDVYEALRKDGASKEKAARIANAQANGSIDHDSTKLENRTKDELYNQAQEIGIDGRSKMGKQELIEAIRNH